jgi:two-component sensor histidine kinase
MLNTTSKPFADIEAFWSANSDRDDRDTDEKLLLRDAHHRMTNTLALLAAGMRQDFTQAEPIELRYTVRRFERRILAFAELYRLLTNGAESDTLERSVGDYLANLCRALAAAILEPIGIRCEASVEDGLLPTRQCERLGLIVTELVTNAAKHAFPNGKIGSVRVEMRGRGGCWHCGVSDNGIGFFNPACGSGAGLIKALAATMGARTLTQSDWRGTRIAVIVPTDRRRM